MIAFNGQYLDKASHGNMRITAACLGGQWVIGGNWLMTATAQAIIAAFGAEEGIAVIRRTNDYLNRIATTDPQRAQQLAGFINEDPLLVTSLVETSKTRWLVGDGVAYINTGLIPNTDTIAVCEYKITSINSGANGIFGCRNKYQQNEMMVWCYVNHIECGWGNNNTQPEMVRQNYQGAHIVSLGNGVFSYDGVQYNGSPRGTFTSTAMPCFIFAVNTGGAPDGQRALGQDVAKFSMNDHTLLPFTYQGEAGMLDIISGTFHPNANTEGAFTIAITDKQ